MMPAGATTSGGGTGATNSSDGAGHQSVVSCGTPRVGTLQKVLERVTASIDRGFQTGASASSAAGPTTISKASVSGGSHSLGKPTADKAAWDRFVFDL